MAAHHVLDQVQSAQRVAGLADEPGGYAEQLEAELAALGEPASRDALAARDERLRDALARIDTLTERAMRIQMDHELASDPSIGIPTRKVFATTVLGYGHQLDLLATRARDVASRGGAADPEAVARCIVDAARAALALRAAVRAGVLELTATLATASTSFADACARDRRADEVPRRGWSAIRRELEAVAAAPERIATGAFAARLAAWPDQLDEPDPASEPTFADLIEMD